MVIITNLPLSVEHNMEPTLRSRDFTNWIEQVGHSVVIEKARLSSDLHTLSHIGAKMLHLEHERNVDDVQSILASGYTEMPEGQVTMPAFTVNNKLVENPRFNKFQCRQEE
jgi:hypothetical protein